jgi:hypothetical protein
MQKHIAQPDRKCGRHYLCRICHKPITCGSYASLGYRSFYRRNSIGSRRERRTFLGWGHVWCVFPTWKVAQQEKAKCEGKNDDIIDSLEQAVKSTIPEGDRILNTLDNEPMTVNKIKQLKNNLPKPTELMQSNVLTPRESAILESCTHRNHSIAELLQMERFGDAHPTALYQAANDLVRKGRLKVIDDPTKRGRYGRIVKSFLTIPG